MPFSYCARAIKNLLAFETNTLLSTVGMRAKLRFLTCEEHLKRVRSKQGSGMFFGAHGQIKSQ